MDDLSSKINCSNDVFRLDYADAIHQILLAPLTCDSPDIKGTIKIMDSLKLMRDDLLNLQEVLIDQIEIPTKTKTAFTREYNKTHPIIKNTGKTIKKLSASTELEDEEEEEEEEEDNQNEEQLIEI